MRHQGLIGMLAVETGDKSDTPCPALVTVVYNTPKDTAAFEKYYAATHLPIVSGGQQEIGFVRGEERCLGSDGMIASRFNVHAVERTLSDHSNCVIDLGAGHSVYRDETSLARLESVLTPYPNVFLILPSPDMEESAVVLRARNVQNQWLASFSEQRGCDPAQRRPDIPDPGAVPEVLHELRPECARGVHRSTGERPAE